MSRYKHKHCEAELVADCIQGECEHVQRLYDNYGFGCACPAKHSVVIRDTSIEPEFKKLILRLCDKHFEMMLEDDLLIVEHTCLCFGSDNYLRSTFRRNRL